jgi:predicted nucleotidyltransferase
LDSVVVKSVDDAAVRRAADDYAASLLASRADVEEIIVFGSFASGTYAPGSDLDLLIVLTHAHGPVRDRVPDLLPRRFPVPVDVFPYTREELRERADSPIVAAANASQWRYRR